VVTKLVEHPGVCSDSKNKDGYTPLAFAAMMGHINAVQTLLQHGADQNAMDGKGESVL